MTIVRDIVRPLASASLAFFLGACATFGAEPAGADIDAVHQAGSAVAAGQVLMAAGQPGAALTEYTRATVLDPASKEPWRRIAELHGQQGRPVDALAAIEEVLRRDPADAEANEMFIVNALKVASEGLERLRAGAQAGSGTLRGESLALVEQVVEMFGDEAVPADVRARLAEQAVRRFRASLPHPGQTPPRQADPLDVLGGN